MFDAHRSAGHTEAASPPVAAVPVLATGPTKSLVRRENGQTIKGLSKGRQKAEGGRRKEKGKRKKEKGKRRKAKGNSQFFCALGKGEKILGRKNAPFFLEARQQ
jgi:hypothetical protein